MTSFRNIEYFNYYEKDTQLAISLVDAACELNGISAQISVNEYLANEAPRYQTIRWLEGAVTCQQN
jgi:hypothetical protein